MSIRRSLRHFAPGRALLVVAAAAIALPGPTAAQQAVCGDPTGFCSRGTVQAGCLQRFGAGAIAADDDSEEAQACREELSVYRDCITLIAAQCPGAGGGAQPGAGAPPPGASALEIWNEIKEVEDADVLEAFAATYPSSPLAVLASKRAEALRLGAATPEPAPPEPAPGEAAAPPPPTGPSPEEIAAAQEEARLRAQFREAQGHLNRIGYQVGAVDGIWGEKSSRALERFLRASGRPPSRLLTPETLALLRVAPSGSAAPPPQAPQRPEPESPALKDTVATLTMEVVFRNRSRDRCRKRVAVADQALNISSLKFDCEGTGVLYLITDASGGAKRSTLIYDRETFNLNGTRWRYSARGRGRNPTDIAKVSIDVAFAPR